MKLMKIQGRKSLSLGVVVLYVFPSMV